MSCGQASFRSYSLTWWIRGHGSGPPGQETDDNNQGLAMITLSFRDLRKRKRLAFSIWSHWILNDDWPALRRKNSGVRPLLAERGLDALPWGGNETRLDGGENFWPWPWRWLSGDDEYLPPNGPLGGLSSKPQVDPATKNGFELHGRQLFWWVMMY